MQPRAISQSLPGSKARERANSFISGAGKNGVADFESGYIFADVNNDSRHVVPQNDGETYPATNAAFMWVSGHRGWACGARFDFL